MKTHQISAFTLEKYRLGELDEEDRASVGTALAEDEGLRARLNSLDESDGELLRQYPAEFFGLEQAAFRIARTRTRVRLVGLAALVAVGILLPVLFTVVSRNTLDTRSGITIAAVPPQDRVKGNARLDCELSLFLRESQEAALGDHTVLAEGNTVQLAYTTPAGNEYYGVIFSVDGRSAVTLHYPYRPGQSTQLVSGRRTFLSEAYTLDDAPDFEVFVMVVSAEPLDAQAVLRTARALVENAGDNTAQSVGERSTAAFDDCEVETITVLKKASN